MTTESHSAEVHHGPNVQAYLVVFGALSIFTAVSFAINELVRSGVHVVTLFSDVAGSMRETHVGADNRAAGRTAGLLLARMVTPPRDTLLLSSQATRLSAEIDRRIGFAQVLEERFPKLRLVRTPDLPPDDAGRQLEDYLDTVAVRERSANVASLRPVFAPESVAVIGASRRAGT